MMRDSLKNGLTNGVQYKSLARIPKTASGIATRLWGSSKRRFLISGFVILPAVLVHF